MILNAEELEFSICIQNFIIFEPASQRVKDSDILFKGPEIKDMFYKISEHLDNKTSLPELILVNKITKIGRMLDLVTNFDNLIMTKFFNRIWRRYSYLSNLGETFLDLKTFLEIFPEHAPNYKALIATRLDDEDDAIEDDVVEEAFVPAAVAEEVI